MQLFCSTRHDPPLGPPLPTARKIARSNDFDIWVVDLPLPQFLGEAGALLHQCKVARQDLVAVVFGSHDDLEAW
jgi:hypothetical protein